MFARWFSTLVLDSIQEHEVRGNIQVSVKAEKPNPVSLKSSGTVFHVVYQAFGQAAATRPRGRERLPMDVTRSPLHEGKTSLLLTRGKSN